MIKKILLAEDDRVTAFLVQKQLESRGYVVDIAVNGVEALKILHSKSIDLIITDVVMPKMDGVDLYSAVKDNPATASIPIIIVTDKEVFKESFKNLGVSNFLEKTNDIKILIDKIHQIEKQSDDVKNFSKIIISSTRRSIIEQMQTALKGKQYLVTTADTSDAIMSKAILMEPHVIVLDVLFQDKVSAPELINALRCFSSLKRTKIITYAYFPEELGIDVEAVQSVENAMAMCKAAGSDMYIGRFNPSFFIERLTSLTL